MDKKKKKNSDREPGLMAKLKCEKKVPQPHFLGYKALAHVYFVKEVSIRQCRHRYI